tara:strand:- start:15465 stop:16187 length:723 start_codon:yes stop_codon:yes gene_type:complete
MHTGYFDGATNPNPGELGLGACIVDHKGDEVIATSSYRPYGTNNEAEYLSLILLLKMAKKAGIKELECYGDSKLIINQVNGAFNVSEKFRPYHSEVLSLSSCFDSISFNWVKRDLNTRADALSKAGLSLKRCKNTSGPGNTQRSKSETCIANNPGMPIDDASTSNTGFLGIQPRNTGKVKVIPNGRSGLVIVENGNSYSLNLSTMQCTCCAFTTEKTCLHTVEAKKILRQSAKKVASLVR